MQYQPNTIYHLYNQGNNRQQIFFEDENYLFFLRKMRKHLLPFGDLLAYCLMPNHFHWLFRTSEAACLTRSQLEGKQLEGTSKVPSNLTSNLKVPSNLNTFAQTQELSKNIGILLSSYTKAINKRYDKSGSLFRGKTKAKDGIIDGFITVNGKNKNLFFGQKEGYEKICFDYIHQNPVKAKLAGKAEDWRYSSAVDYVGLRKGTICNQNLARELALL